MASDCRIYFRKDWYGHLVKFVVCMKLVEKKQKQIKVKNLGRWFYTLAGTKCGEVCIV